jgi:hypothetical protein
MTLKWKIPDFDGQPIAKAGLRIIGAGVGESLFVDSYTWDHEPETSFHAPAEGGKAWRRAWVNAVDSQNDWDSSHQILIQNRGRGLICTGTLAWKNYRAQARFKLRAAKGGGLAVRYGGLERYYGLLLRREGFLTLFKRRDGIETILGEVAFEWEYEAFYDLFLRADGAQLTAGIGDQILLRATDVERPLLTGGIALLIEEGCLMAKRVTVAP